jgi:hypothetical protein
MVTSAVTLANSYDSGELIGEDDSTLPLRDYRATWVLMVVSGVFCIMGKQRTQHGAPKPHCLTLACVASFYRVADVRESAARGPSYAAHVPQLVRLLLLCFSRCQMPLIGSCSYYFSGTLPIPSHAPHRNNVVWNAGRKTRYELTR